MLSEEEIGNIIRETVEPVFGPEPIAGAYAYVDGIGTAAHAIAERLAEDVAELKAENERLGDAEDRYLAHIDDLEGQKRVLWTGLDDICGYVKSIPERQRDDALQTVWDMAGDALVEAAKIDGGGEDET